MLGDDLVHQWVDWKSVARVADRRLRHLAETHGAEAFERRDPGVGRRRHHGSHDSLRDLAAVVLLEVVPIERLRPGAQARNRDDAIFGGRINDDWRDARNVHEFRLHDAERNATCDTSVNRIATRFQNLKASFSREILSGRDHVARAHDGRAVAFHALPRDGPVAGMEIWSVIRYLARD